MKTATAVREPPRARRGRPPIAGLRETILRAAEDIFTRHDYHEVLMEDVARACGVGKGTLYRYFPGKRELYLAVVFEGIARLCDEMHAAVRMPDQPIRRLQRAIECVLAYFWERRLFFALIHHNEQKPDDPDSRQWLRRRAELSQIFQRAIEEAIMAGQIRSIDPRIAAEMLLGMLRGVNRYRGAKDRRDDLVQTVVDTFLCGVATPAGQRLGPEPPARRGR